VTAFAGRVRVAVCADYREEAWPSMDRVAGELLAAIRAEHAPAIEATAVCPPFSRRATRFSSGSAALNIDRGLNRLVDYPRHVGRLAASYDVFHVVDHSYSQLVYRLPSGRSIVTCHDLDTFRSVMAPMEEPRSPLFKAMTRHILEGLRRAAWVTCDTAAVRDEILARDIAPAERVVVAPIGVGAEFRPDANADLDRELDALVASPPGSVEILHVGSNAHRKRLDRVLRLTADLVGMHERVRLVRVGGPFTDEQQRLVRDLGLTGRITTLPPLDDRHLAALYRRAALVVLPSDREGFGLPVVEALACGAPVLASDLPALREVGGPAAGFCAPEDRESWAREASQTIRERVEQPHRWRDRRDRGLAWTARFSWSRFANQMAGVYQNVAGVTPQPSASEPCHV
jgi:glycosyltransferase involved in cell wall biosynthesis